MDALKNLSRRSFVAGAAAVAAAAGMAANIELEAPVALADAPAGGKLVVSLSSSPSKLDPIHYSGTYESQIIGQVTDRLIEYNDALDAFEPSLATEWTVSDDGVTYIFKIREGVKFQNGQYVQGRELTADDVAYSLNRSAQFSDNNRLAMLANAEVTGDFEVTCTLDGPNASFLTALTDAGNSIVAKEEVEGWGDDFGVHLTGTGPFILEQFNLDENAVLTAFPDYWMGASNLGTLEFVFISDPTQAANKVVTGEVDIATDIKGEAIDTIRYSGTAEIWETQALQINYIRFNMRHEAMSDVRVRRAMIEAVPFDDVRASLYQYNDAVAAYLPLPYGSWGYDAQYEALFPGYDPDDAKALMNEAGWGNGFDITIYVSNTQERRDLAALLQYYWGQIGITVEINSSEWGTFSDTVCSGNAPVYAMSWSWYPDPYFFLNKLFSSDETSAIGNGAGYVNPEVDALLTAAFETTDQEERKAYYGQVIEIVMNDCAGIYYANPTLFYGVTPRVVDFVQRADGTLRFVTAERNTSVTD